MLLYIVKEDDTPFQTTELFFNNPYEKIDGKLINHDIYFSIKNLEGKPMDYNYMISLDYNMENSSYESMIQTGYLSLTDQESIALGFVIPKSTYKNISKAINPVIKIDLYKTSEKQRYRHIKKRIEI